MEVGERLAANEIIIINAIMSFCILEGCLAILWGLAAYGVEAWAAEEGVLEVVAQDPLAPCGTAANPSDTSIPGDSRLLSNRHQDARAL